jgi:predicted RNase H-like HicB family nuclease
MFVVHFATDLPQTEGETVVNFADETGIMAVGDDVEDATERLQRAANEINDWTKQWLNKLMKTSQCT